MTTTAVAPKRRRLTPRWRDYGRPRELIVRYLLLFLVLGLTVGPLLWQLLASLKSTGEDVFGSHASLLPHHPTLRAYRTDGADRSRGSGCSGVPFQTLRPGRADGTSCARGSGITFQSLRTHWTRNSSRTLRAYRADGADRSRGSGCSGVPF